MPGDHVAHLARLERVDRGHARAEEADVVDVGLGAGLHRDDRVALAQRARRPRARRPPRRGTGRTRSRRSARAAGPRCRRSGGGTWLTIASSTSVTPSPVLADMRITSSAGLPSSSRDLPRHPLGLGARQVDLVQRRDQLQAGVDGQVGVGHRLGLDALGGVHHQQRAVARGERARDLVGEVHVAGRVDQVQPVGLAVLAPCTRTRTAWALIVMPRSRSRSIESSSCGPVLARVHGAGDLEDAVGQRRLPVVDVGDDREVADVPGGSGHGAVRLGAARKVALPRATTTPRARSRGLAMDTHRAIEAGVGVTLMVLPVLLPLLAAGQHGGFATGAVSVMRRAGFCAATLGYTGTREARTHRGSAAFDRALVVALRGGPPVLRTPGSARHVACSSRAPWAPRRVAAAARGHGQT